MIQFSNIVKKWRETNSSEGEQKQEKDKLKFNIGAQKVLRKVSESCDNEREISQKKFSNALEKLEDKKEKTFVDVKKVDVKKASPDIKKTSDVRRTSPQSSTKKPFENVQKSVPDNKKNDPIFEQIEEDLIPVVSEQKPIVTSQNEKWQEEDDFTEGLFERELKKPKDQKQLKDQREKKEDTSEFFDDQNDDEIANVTEDDKKFKSYHKDYRSNNQNKSKYKNSNRSTKSRSKEYPRNHDKKEKNHYPKKDDSSTISTSGEHLNIENVLKSMKSNSTSYNRNERTNDQGENGRRNFSSRKNGKDKKNHHKWI